MAGTSQKRPAAEPPSETRVSTRNKSASSKQRETNEQAESDLRKELEHVKRQLEKQKRKNQKLVEKVQESHSDVDAEWGPESEESEGEPSSMQFSTAIRSKGVVEKPQKLKARKATDPPPVYRNHGHELSKEPEQDQSTVVSPATPYQHPQVAMSLSSPPPPPPPPLARSPNNRDHILSSNPSGSTPRAPNEKRARVTAKAYPEHTKQLIAATRVYYTKIWTSNPFPDEKLQAQWAVDSWNVVSDGVPLPDNGMIQYISNCGSNARTLLKDCVRKLVPVHYKLTKSGGKTEAVLSNVERVKSLLDRSVFHYKTVKGSPRFCEHPIIRAIISDMWFSNDGYGVKYTESFSPISLSTLALLITMIEFCLNEWKTGMFVDDKLQESSLKKKFSDHLQSVVSWNELNPEVTKKIRQKIFNDLFASVGPISTSTSGALHLNEEMREKLAADLAERMGDTDVESDHSDTYQALGDDI